MSRALGRKPWRANRLRGPWLPGEVTTAGAAGRPQAPWRAAASDFGADAGDMAWGEDLAPGLAVAAWLSSL
ncbi:hypothetical protein F751_1813 [Auxenochlorella protothecoides]|uniref:Uncharacterized protein n=1 Tax=Auxenochlorella protothecoides TaxID=3075 RepID=A0A087SGT0_AUXPR|nr:hypothetical protein F751_1813 [Auxenochlorella protothecoides]KFM24934.1 hypothetical protein F751_1813 [Auxenochlorella protothecoides]